MANTSTFRRYVAAIVFLLTLVSGTYAKYSGGSGTAQDPYQIATAADLLLLGETPEDYDKHFILTDDIDLHPNLPGRKVFDKAVIAPEPSWEGGTPFTGVFDGNGHTVSDLTIRGQSYLGVFGYLGSGAEVKDLGVVDVSIFGSGESVGGLVGTNGYWGTPGGSVADCYSTGAVIGGGWSAVGGLVGGRGQGAHVTDSFWYTQTSGRTKSAGGIAKTTAEMPVCELRKNY